MDGIAPTIDNLRDIALSDGHAAMERAFRDAIHDEPSSGSHYLAMLWFTKPVNANKAGKVELAWEKFNAAIEDASDQAAIDTAMSEFKAKLGEEL